MIEYFDIAEKDIPQIMELYARYLNSGESYGNSIRRAWEDGNFFGYTALSEGRMAGVLAMREGIEFTYPHPALLEELLVFSAGKRIGFCDALLILPKYRHAGVGHRLAEQSRRLLIRMGFDYFMSEIWIYPDGRSPAKEVFETMGEVIWTRRFPGFYRDLSAYGMGCPICGADCVCGAWVEVMDVRAGMGRAAGPACEGIAKTGRMRPVSQIRETR